MADFAVASKLRYAADEIRENGRNPNWWRNRVNDRINRPIQAAIKDGDGVHIMEEDWDTLVILDGCRADVFEAVVGSDQFDAYRRVISRGSATSEWSRKNFPDKYDDTVYVSGNPVPTRHLTGEFVEFRQVWREAFDDELGTVRADAITEAAREAHADHPNKRLIVHYMQPHYPFVGSDFDFSYWNQTEGIDFGDDDRAREAWSAIGRGLADKDEVLEAYENNLRYVMDSVWELVDDLDGKTVLHSDHGNLTGERSWPVPVKTYGHPSGIWLSGLRTVPWAIIDGENRRKITSGTTSDRRRETDDDVEDKLAALGYAD